MSESASSMLQDILTRLNNSGQDVHAIREQVMAATSEYVWVPNPGPQTAALMSEADELFYGGTAGGGKSDLGIGAALTQHRSSLILRRFNEDARELAERMLEIVGNRNGYNGQLLLYNNPDKRLRIAFGGCKEESDKQRYKGRARDLIVFDEIPDFLKTQYEFIIGWNRSAVEGQRSRVICTGNPPTTAEGLWVIQYWGAWLDPAHPNPAREGELRWYVTGDDGQDIEFDHPGPYFNEDGSPMTDYQGFPILTRSRTFIRAKLDDNPDLVRTDDYRKTLSSLPLAYRDAYRDGKFDAALKDKENQVIPTAWVLQAQERWRERPPAGVPQCAIGADVAQGGGDNNIISVRYDGWFAPLVVIPGVDTPLGTDLAGPILIARKHDSVVTLDCGGGYGGATYNKLKENGITCKVYKGAEAYAGRSTEGAKLMMHNMRAWLHWKFREALDPSQEWGSNIALPPDPELVSDLTAPTYTIGRSGVQIEAADKVAKRIGRSPDRGYSVMLAWLNGDRGISHLFSQAPRALSAEQGVRPRSTTPRVVHSPRMSHRRK